MYVPGWYVGPIRLLDGLDTAPASAALLFFVFLLLPAAAAIALARNRGSSGPLGQWERVKIAAVVVVAILTFTGFVREALDARIGMPWSRRLCSARGCRRDGWRAREPSLWSRAARVAILVALLIPVTRSIVVAGGVEPRFERAEPLRDVASARHEPAVRRLAGTGKREVPDRALRAGVHGTERAAVCLVGR